MRVSLIRGIEEAKFANQLATELASEPEGHFFQEIHYSTCPSGNPKYSTYVQHCALIIWGEIPTR